MEGRLEETKGKVLECLMSFSQLSRLLWCEESPVTDDDIYSADSNQCHNAYGGLKDEEYIFRKDDVSLVDLGDDDTGCLVASSQNTKDQEITSLQHLTESSEGSDNNEGLALNAHECTTVEGSASNREEESMLREDLCEILEGKRLFEEGRQSRRTIMADLQESVRKKQLNSERGNSIQSNKASVNNVSKLQSIQNGSNCGNLEVPHQNPEAQASSRNPISRNVSTHENDQRISSIEGSTAKEEDKLMRIHQLPQGPALNNVKDRNDLDMEPKFELPEDVISGLPKTTLVKEYHFTSSNKSDSSSILERETYAKNVETARNDVFLSGQNAIKTNRETSPNQEVQGIIEVDQEGQRQTKPGGNKFKSRKQHLEEESERSEVEIRGNSGNTPEKQETPCSDSESRSTISNPNESTTRPMCQGGDVVAEDENLEDLNKNSVAFDGSILEKNYHNDIHAMIVMPNHAVQDAIAVDLRQTKPGVNKLEISKQHLVEDRERSGVEIIGNRSNTLEKQGTSCPDHDEVTTERTFAPPIEDGLRDGTKNKDISRSQNDVLDLLRETDTVDGPNLKEENETRSLKQSLGAVKLLDPHGQAHFKTKATLSNRHEITSRSIFHGGDVVADGGSRGDLINNVDIVDGPAFTQSLQKDFHAGEKFETSVKHKVVTLGSENESQTDRDALCESRYPLEPKSNLFQSHSGDGGARPKQRSTDNTKTRLPQTSYKNPMSANSDLEIIYPGLDPVFLARHVKESSPLLPFHKGGNYNHASSDGLWQEDYEQEYFSFNAQDQLFNSKDQKSHDVEDFILRDKANIYGKVIPINNALAALAPSNGKEKESWHFPPSESCKDMVLRNQCFAERTNESNPTSLPKSFDANREKPFCSCGSACAYKDMDSMANDYSTSVGNNECGQSPSLSENEHSGTEHALTSNFRYLQQLMAKTIRLVALNATGARENDPANQTVEKTGIQEETGDMGEAEAAVTQRIYETNTQRESTPSNETTVEAERQPTATPVQESPRPVCSHYQRRCLVRFPCCGKFFPCHRCHNESDCSEDQARAVNATHIRCTICYHEQEVRFLFMILCLCFHVKIRYLE